MKYTDRNMNYGSLKHNQANVEINNNRTSSFEKLVEVKNSVYSKETDRHN